MQYYADMLPIQVEICNFVKIRPIFSCHFIVDLEGGKPDLIDVSLELYKSCHKKAPGSQDDAHLVSMSKFRFVTKCRKFKIWTLLFWGIFFSYPKPYLRDSETGKAEMLHNDAILC